MEDRPDFPTITEVENADVEQLCSSIRIGARMADNSKISRLLGSRGRFEWGRRRRHNAKRLVKI